MKKYLLNLAIFFCVLLFTSYSFSQIVSGIQVKGNKRISKDTIIETIDYEKNKDYSEMEFNKIIKDLYATNFFSNIKIFINNNNLIIEVKENPLINYFYIQGVENKTREELFYDKLSLGTSKLFSESLLKKDLEDIRKVYINSGYYDVNVTPEISKLSDNTLNVVIKVERNDKYKINKINFIGNKAFDASILKDVISTSENGWWKFLSSSTTLSQNSIEIDKVLLKEFYLNEGFYDIQILSSDIEFINKNEAIITYAINSGNKYFFSKFKLIDDNLILSKKQFNEINEIIKNKLKGNFSKRILLDLKTKIIDYFNKNKVEFVDISIIPEKISNKLISINFNIKVTERKFVNLITVKGNQITEEEVIRRNLIFSEGDSFVSHKLATSKRNLESLGIFKEIKTKIIENKDNEKIDFEINVEEQPTGTISAGVGVGSEETSVNAGINERNLFGKGIVANSNISVGTAKISGITSLKIQDFKNTGREAKFDFFAVSTDFENAGYESKKVGNLISSSYSTFEDVSFLAGFGLDRDSIETSSSASELYKSRAGDYMTYKFVYGATLDSRDRKFSTSRGKIVNFQQSIAVPGSDIPFLDNRVSASYYYPLSSSNKYIVNIKGNFNSINALDNKDVKLSDRKFSTSRIMRGFESRGIGPKDGKDHVGGNYSAFASLSSTFPNPAPEKWRANSSVFFDAGNVWGVDYDSSLDSDKIRTSVGLSLDWFSPLGPLNFTLSNVLSSADGDLEESFTFNLGSTF